MNDIFDVLDTCLREIENGAEMETVLARYPDFGAELRPILMASIMARSLSAPAPSPEAVRRGRAKVLQHAAQMREAKSAPRSRRAIPFFQRLAIALTLAALFLTSGTGLVSASSSALPGEKLYSVKLTWENIRLFLTFDEGVRESLEHSFENERLHEVSELLLEGRQETIRFDGVYMEVNGVTYVAGIRIVILDASALPPEPLVNGVAVAVTGHTNAEGFVEAETIELLPAGTVVPTGEPPEIEEELEYDDNSSNNMDNRNEDDNENDISIDIPDDIPDNNQNEENVNETNSNDSVENTNDNSNDEETTDSNNEETTDSNNEETTDSNDDNSDTPTNNDDANDDKSDDHDNSDDENDDDNSDGNED
ncbi:MAG: hypothetical protein HY865_25980 [Chloroflexi bacterium]|nr:hypothetical protein [Chloroflexota bacterium]